MKITSQEEYGLRILLRIANSPDSEGLTIPQIGELEGLSHHYVAKLCRILRLGGFINSSRGKEGGYSLATPANQIYLNDVLDVLGNRFYTKKFCKEHTGTLEICTRTMDCSVRSVWKLVQQSVDQVLDNYTLQDLLSPESRFQRLNSEFS